ncbi:unnamed protein product [Brassica rapa]|uniref:Uncharacterized protein n=1 Tax=Brassica campestris TaxID=3711 RepID=A0A8D9D9H8_BRACM|nr:unnamed protein product [Brassica rapa]
MVLDETEDPVDFDFLIRGLCFFFVCIRYYPNAVCFIYF